MPVAPCCPKCLRPLRELGIRYSDRRIVPRRLLQMKGVEIRGEPEGVDYACFGCLLPVHQTGVPTRSRSL